MNPKLLNAVGVGLMVLGVLLQAAAVVVRSQERQAPPSKPAKRRVAIGAIETPYSSCTHIAGELRWICRFDTKDGAMVVAIPTLEGE